MRSLAPNKEQAHIKSRIVLHDFGASIGTVGLDWQFAGIGPVHGAGESDLVLRNKNTGAFEVYDIANNQLTAAAPLGAVGLDWQLGEFAADPPTGSMGSPDGPTSQLVPGNGQFRRRQPAEPKI